VRTLIAAADIRREVERLGRRIDAEFPEGPLVIVGVLTGCVLFLADLVRAISRPVRIALIQASSYRGEATRPGALRFDLDGLPDLQQLPVLLLDDIFDTGRTLSTLRTELLSRGAASVHTVTLLWKTARREVELLPDYYAFEIPDEFVVGYGLDFDDHFRNLPEIAVLEPSDIEALRASPRS